MTRFFRWAAVPIMLGLLAAFPFLRGLDWRGLDLVVPGHPPYPKIVILAIDNQSIADIGRWPWSRSVHAELLRTLAAASPRIVAIDVAFSEPSTSTDDAALANAMREVPFPIVLPVQVITRTDGTEQQLPPLSLFRANSNVHIGNVHVQEAEDQTARLFPQPALVEGETIPAFSSVVASLLGVSDIDPSSRALQFAGPAGTYTTLSVRDVRGGRVAPESLQDAIILIGATASDLHDLVRVPAVQGSVMAGIEWHANVVDALVTQRSLTVFPWWVTCAVAIVMGLLTLGAFTTSGIRVALALTGLLLVLLIALSAVLASAFGVALPFVTPSFTMAGTASIFGFWKLFITDREKRRLRRAMSNYFSPRAMEAILSSPTADILGGKRKEVSVFFSDMRNFTTISEQSDPELLCSLLQEYFTAMSEELHASEGVLEKFVGDAIMAFWGAPLDMEDHAERAVRTALRMYDRFRTLRNSWEARGIHGVDIGMAVNTGPVLVGNMGSRVRFNYGIMGDTVNSTARMEGLNKEFGAHLIISAATEAKLPPDISRRPLGDVMVKGKTKPLTVFEVRV